MINKVELYLILITLLGLAIMSTRIYLAYKNNKKNQLDTYNYKNTEKRFNK